MPDPVIVAACRTAIGKFGGALEPLTAPQLGAVAIREAVQRAGIDSALVEEVLMGHVLQAGVGQNPARQAARGAGIPDAVGSVTINKVCGSGLKSVMLAAQGIALGDIDVAVAGGMESMSNCPHLLPRVREGLRMGDGKIIDSMIHDGLWDAFHDIHMGLTGEHVSEKYGVSREAQDQYAADSHRKAAHATREGWFRAEILPVSIPQKKGDPIIIDRDESIREDTTAEALGRLKPAFKKDGTVTAGNAPGVNDGAAAVVAMGADVAARLKLSPIARVAGYATAGLEPKLVMMTPVEAVRKLVKKIDWALADVDLVELNEAFAVQAVAVTRELGLDPGRVNVQGGAVALGHPIGASGARILTTLIYALKRRGGRRGIATLCLGGGNGVAMAIEMVN
jgi:acetyl-CoA C-acetyltransferase